MARGGHCVFGEPLQLAPAAWHNCEIGKFDFDAFPAPGFSDKPDPMQGVFDGRLDTA